MTILVGWVNDWSSFLVSCTNDKILAKDNAQGMRSKRTTGRHSLKSVNLTNECPNFSSDYTSVPMKEPKLFSLFRDLEHWKFNDCYQRDLVCRFEYLSEMENASLGW
eukprot:CAMPEP_0174375632 /NCGR_PEP_ID=MMETSP0811_2-20130205/115327_1 /TAXON_ID=73025 ORGANISM="Eutreptiella gymnastica-like, Strain CCMP1594" /NCGR_SAMPLE_ID=MMETSP0811_2 /ASSEMBLY_ACC=CAM_ASM_000667 /LENGTH=106 /DNA_ID=CAMNT_0015526087 /DNA_START=271 /DNA_END=588 /DNA_ORIENTATION=+